MNHQEPVTIGLYLWSVGLDVVKFSVGRTTEVRKIPIEEIVKIQRTDIPDLWRVSLTRKGFNALMGKVKDEPYSAAHA